MAEVFLTGSKAVKMAFNTTLAITMGNVTEVDKGPSQAVYVIVLEMVVISITWLISIPTNVLVCVVVYRSRRVQSTTNFFVVSLAISDLVLALLCTPFISAHIIADQWVFGNIVCRLVRFFQTLAPTSSIMIIVAISIDRFYTIIYPLSFKITRGTAKHLISFCWVVAFILSVPALYFIDCSHNEDQCPLFFANKNWGTMMYGTLLVTLTFIITAIFLTVIYSRIFRHVWTIGPRKRLFRRTTNPVSRTKVKMLKMLIYVTVTSMSMLTPQYVTQLWYSYNSFNSTSIKLFALTYILVFLTTITKPIIYVLFNSNFRRGCREVFCMTSMKCYRRNNYVITNPSTMSKKNYVGIMPTESKERHHSSPTVTFNRNTLMDKTVWPLSSSMSSTYI